MRLEEAFGVVGDSVAAESPVDNRAPDAAAAGVEARGTCLEGACQPRKRAMRKLLLRERAEQAPDERASIDTRIAHRVVAAPAFVQSETVLIYLSFGSEVETRSIIRAAWELGKAVALPRVFAARSLRWYRVDSLDGLRVGSFGIKEPPPCEDREVIPGSTPGHVAIVPGLAFDCQGFRLGYGGGFYDVFLASFPGVSIGLCRERQLCASLDDLGVIDPHDRRVDFVVTEQRMVSSASPTSIVG